MATRNISARRKLSELYARGVEVRFAAPPVGGRVGPFVDENGKAIPAAADEVVVWVQPPSPLERDMAMRDANAARARAHLRTLRDSESQEALTAQVFLAGMDFPTLVDYVLLHEQEQRRMEATREVLARDEWKEFSAYQDSFRKMVEDEVPEDDPDHAELIRLDLKFGQQVSDRERELNDAAHEVLMMLGRDNVERQALELRKDIAGSQAFIHEYELQMTFYSVRDFKDRSVLFFESSKEWASQDEEIRTTVSEALSTFVGEAAEAKNSPGAVSGSDSSEAPSKPETSEASTPQDANE